MIIEDKDIKQKKLLFFFPLIKCGDDQSFLCLVRTWDDEKSVIYLLLLLVRHGQNNYFFGRAKLEKIR